MAALLARGHILFEDVPGVGKTTIIRALVDVFNARKLEVHLAAPTGRAAKRKRGVVRRGTRKRDKLTGTPLRDVLRGGDRIRQRDGERAKIEVAITHGAFEQVHRR